MIDIQGKNVFMNESILEALCFFRHNLTVSFFPQLSCPSNQMDKESLLVELAMDCEEFLPAIAFHLSYYAGFKHCAEWQRTAASKGRVLSASSTTGTLFETRV